MKKAIGIFDSGVGGLTVLKKLTLQYPKEDFIYIGDIINMPYGTKKEEALLNCINKIINILIKMDVKLIIIACNSASSLLFRLPNIEIPLINIISSTSLKVISITKKKRVGLIATSITINNKEYEKILNKYGIEVISKACDEFVLFIENNFIDLNVIKEKLSYFYNKDIDVLILGCTHFNYLKKEIELILNNILIIPSSIYFQDELERIKTTEKQRVEIYSTGCLDSLIKYSNLLEINYDLISKIK